MTNFIGTIADADGDLLGLTIGGPNGYKRSESYSTSFELPLDLTTGTYVVSVEVSGPGKFEFSITGDAKNIAPPVPMDISNSTKIFTFDIS